MRAGEGVIGEAALDHGGALREVLEPALEIVAVTDGEADEADVGHRHRVAVAIGAALGVVYEVRLDRPQPLGEPMPAPGKALRLVQRELPLQELADARHDERMRVAGNDLREATHPRPAARV